MKDPKITYRGATSPMSELNDLRISQLEQQQGTRQVQYRGQAMDADLHPYNEKKPLKVSYRGASAEVEL
ncbi:MAG: hypothetical protein P1V20_13305 [Verrucomicrobiales bacterium]|nr:hypothetical protein [Verrucomicrobiales bacterium]